MHDDIMKVVEKFGVPEPQWILDRAESGSQFWRRLSTGNKTRVKFLADVEVKEFKRSAHEYEECNLNDEDTSLLTMGLTCMFCITVTILLPWYVLIGPN